MNSLPLIQPYINPAWQRNTDIYFIEIYENLVHNINFRDWS